MGRANLGAELLTCDDGGGSSWWRWSSAVDPGEVWANEATEFTPWLGENIDLLCDALGVELEITELEGK